MLHNTKGIVLRTVKYGETSIIANVLTELFGIQSYLVNGIRTQSRSSSRAGLLQPASILEMEVYHNELKNLQRIKEFKWAYLHKDVLSDVIKNAVAVYMIELVQKCVKQPENNVALFRFCENSLMQLDSAREEVTANFPLFFSLHLVNFFGFSIHNNFSVERPVLDMQEGMFTDLVPLHAYYLQAPYTAGISQLLRARYPEDLTEVKLNRPARKQILVALQTFYSLHIPEFGIMKTLPVLHEILG